MNITEFIKALGGPVHVSRQLGIRSQAISIWARRGKIPAERVPQLVGIARTMGLKVTPKDMRPDINWQLLCECHYD